MTHTCPRCETPFTPKRQNQLFCTPACKDAAHSEARRFGTLLIEAGYLTYAQLRAVFAAISAIGSIEALVAQATAERPCTDTAAHSDGEWVER